MGTEELKGISWLSPWEPAAPVVAEALEAELHREVGYGHPLFHKPVRAVARRCDNDDVLFYVETAPSPLAVVHLTWSGHNKPASAFPYTTFYDTVGRWVSDCMRRDHAALE